MTITATFIDGKHENGRNYGGDKEMVSAYSVVSLVDGVLRDPVTARSYMGRSRSASTVWTTVWLGRHDIYRSGTGSAGGYGYHKESAAMHGALQAAGVQLSEPIHGRGDGLIREALMAVAEALHPGCQHLFVSH